MGMGTNTMRSDDVRVLSVFEASKVTGFGSKAEMTAVAAMGWAMATGTLAMYIMTWRYAYMYEVNKTAGSVWGLVLLLHCIEMILVGIEAVYTSGFFWPMQMLVIGNGTTITFMVVALLGAAISQGDNVDPVYLHLNIVSLAVACFSNAMLLSMLWEHFHRAAAKALNVKGK